MIMIKNLFFSLTFILCISSGVAQVGINTEIPHHSAELDVVSNNKGFIPSKMTTLQRNLITNATQGLLIYNRDSKCLEFFNGIGWYNFCDGITIIPPTGPPTPPPTGDFAPNTNQNALKSSKHNSKAKSKK